MIFCLFDVCMFFEALFSSTDTLLLSKTQFENHL